MLGLQVFGAVGVSLGRGAVLGVLGRVHLHITDQALTYLLLDTNKPLALAGDTGNPLFPLYPSRLLQGHDSCARAAVTPMDHSHQPPLATSADTPPLQPLCSTSALPSATAQFSMPTHPWTRTKRWDWTIFLLDDHPISFIVWATGSAAELCPGCCPPSTA